MFMMSCLAKVNDEINNKDAEFSFLKIVR